MNIYHKFCSSNQITTLSDSYFLSFRNTLTTLFLGDNQIIELPDDFFSSFKRLLFAFVFVFVIVFECVFVCVLNLMECTGPFAICFRMWRWLVGFTYHSDLGSV